MASASMTLAPSSRKKPATVDLPQPIEEVKPTTSISRPAPIHPNEKARAIQSMAPVFPQAFCRRQKGCCGLQPTFFPQAFCRRQKGCDHSQSKKSNRLQACQSRKGPERIKKAGLAT